MSKNPVSTLPHARTTGIIENRLTGEVLVYDLKRHRAHCLNQTAALVWDHCDGRTTVAQMTEILGRELGTEVDEKVVWLALHRLEQVDLLSDKLPAPSEKVRLPRRELMKKLGWATAASLPLVTTLLAPTTTQAQSCVQRGGPCTTNAQCCSGNCRGNNTCG